MVALPFACAPKALAKLGHEIHEKAGALSRGSLYTFISCGSEWKPLPSATSEKKPL